MRGARVESLPVVTVARGIGDLSIIVPEVNQRSLFPDENALPLGLG
jgi:hypothetical protein